MFISGGRVSKEIAGLRQQVDQLSGELNELRKQFESNSRFDTASHFSQEAAIQNLERHTLGEIQAKELARIRETKLPGNEPVNFSEPDPNSISPLDTDPLVLSLNRTGKLTKDKLLTDLIEAELINNLALTNSKDSEQLTDLLTEYALRGLAGSSDLYRQIPKIKEYAAQYACHPLDINLPDYVTASLLGQSDLAECKYYEAPPEVRNDSYMEEYYYYKGNPYEYPDPESMRSVLSQPSYLKGNVCEKIIANGYGMIDEAVKQIRQQSFLDKGKLLAGLHSSKKPPYQLSKVINMIKGAVKFYKEDQEYTIKKMQEYTNAVSTMDVPFQDAKKKVTSSKSPNTSVA